MGTMATTLKIF